jgi:hypothetical protein
MRLVCALVEEFVVFLFDLSYPIDVFRGFEGAVLICPRLVLGLIVELGEDSAAGGRVDWVSAVGRVS